MARVYNSTRLMLDPNFILSARRAADEREAAARESRRDIAKGINQTLGAIGGGIDYALRNMAKSDRRDIMASLKTQFTETSATPEEANVILETNQGRPRENGPRGSRPRKGTWN